MCPTKLFFARKGMCKEKAGVGRDAEIIAVIIKCLFFVVIWFFHLNSVLVNSSFLDFPTWVLASCWVLGVCSGQGADIPPLTLPERGALGSQGVASTGGAREHSKLPGGLLFHRVAKDGSARERTGSVLLGGSRSSPNFLLLPRPHTRPLLLFFYFSPDLLSRRDTSLAT